MEPPAKPREGEGSLHRLGQGGRRPASGLGLPPGEKRAYSHGETVTLVVRVRNVGKEEVKFQYLRRVLHREPAHRDGRHGQAGPPHQRRHALLGYNAPRDGRDPGTGQGNRAVRMEARTWHMIRQRWRPTIEATRPSTERGSSAFSTSRFRKLLASSDQDRPHSEQARHREAGTRSEGSRDGRPEQEKKPSPHGARRSAACKRAWASTPARSGPTSTARRSSWSSGFATSARRRSSSSTPASPSSRTRPS